MGTSLYACIAIALVFNSHLEEFYPYRWLAGDGLLGNSMFFFLSGWGIAVSWESSKRTFLEFCVRRVQRIYPSLILAVFTLQWLPNSLWRSMDIWGYVELFLYPTNFTYVKEIIPGYLILFLLLTTDWIRYWKLILLGLLATYFSWYAATFELPGKWPSLGLVPEPFHSLFYAAVLVAGASHGKRNSSAFSPFWFAIVILVLYLLAKFITSVFQWGFLFPVLHLLCFFAVCVSFPHFEWLAKLVSPHKSAVKFMLLISAITLEIYIVHSLLIDLKWIQSWGLSLLLSIPLLVISTLALAWSLQRLSSKVRFN